MYIKNKLILLFSFLVVAFFVIGFSAKVSASTDDSSVFPTDSATKTNSGDSGGSCEYGANDDQSCMTKTQYCALGSNSSSSLCTGNSTTPLEDSSSKGSTTPLEDSSSKGSTTSSGIYWPTNSGLPENTVSGVLSGVLSWLLGIFGLLALIGFIISGIQYLTSAGNDSMLETAKRNMTWSIVGVIVALSGFVIIQAIDLALRGTGGLF